MAILKIHHWRSIMTVTILDGGMGRELHRRGAPFRQPEWSALALMEAPEIVRETHLDFLRAGAQVITTNSYALVPFHIGQERFDAQAAEWARQPAVWRVKRWNKAGLLQKWPQACRRYSVLTALTCLTNKSHLLWRAL